MTCFHEFYLIRKIYGMAIKTDRHKNIIYKLKVNKCSTVSCDKSFICNNSEKLLLVKNKIEYNKVILKRCKRQLSSSSMISISLPIPPVLIVTSVIAISLIMPSDTTGDAFALLSGTLRTYQKTGCDEDLLKLNCPTNTTISIQFAQYKITSTSSPCPSKYTAGPLTNIVRQNLTCSLPNQIQTVVEACQKKRQCKFHPSTKNFGENPCPDVPKYVEVAYKCRPFEFRSKVACENDVVQLSCEANLRIAVFSASYGRTEYESVECPQPQGVSEETCLVSYATEAVMHVCHGKRRCTLSADAATFGNPCKPASRMYLKVVFTCVPRNVLKEMYESPVEDDELDAMATVASDGHGQNGGHGGFGLGGNEDGGLLNGKDYDQRRDRPTTTRRTDNRHDDFTKDSPQITSTGIPSHRRINDLTNFISHHHDRILSDRGQHYQVQGDEISFSRSDDTSASVVRAVGTGSADKGTETDDGPVSVNVNHNIGPHANSPSNNQVFGIISVWISMYMYIKSNSQRMYILAYIIMSIVGGILLCGIFIVVRLFVKRLKSRRSTEDKYRTSVDDDSTMHRSFGDDISDINGDLMLSTPVPVSVPGLATMHSGTIRPDRDRYRNVVGLSGYGHGGYGHDEQLQLVGGGYGSVPPGQDNFRTLHGHSAAERGEEVPRGLSRASDSHYYYG